MDNNSPVQNWRHLLIIPGVLIFSIGMTAIKYACLWKIQFTATERSLLIQPIAVPCHPVVAYGLAFVGGVMAAYGFLQWLFRVNNN